MKRLSVERHWTVYELASIVLLVAVVYVYAGYPLALWCVTRTRTLVRHEVPDPEITVVIAAHNEQESIGKTLSTLRRSAYRAGAMRILVVSDGSTDATKDVVAGHEGVTFLDSPARRGKDRSLAEAMQRVKTSIVVAMDASTLVDPLAIRLLVAHLTEDTVGAAVGSKSIARTGTSVSETDGAYWRYERLLRHMESLSGSSWVGVEGGLFATRKEYWPQSLSSRVAFDLAVGGHLYGLGKRIVFDTRASFVEAPSASMSEEFGRKVRVIVRGIRAFLASSRNLAPWKHPTYYFQVVSHKLLRWLVPFMLLGLLFTSARAGNEWVQGLFMAQLSFYGLAFVGALLQPLGFRSPLCAVPLYFVAMNAAALVAWLSLWRDFSSWNRTQRA